MRAVDPLGRVTFRDKFRYVASLRPRRLRIASGRLAELLRGFDGQRRSVSISDISSYAGQTVNFRFRLGSDNSAGRTDGRNIDDVAVQPSLVVPVELRSFNVQ